MLTNDPIVLAIDPGSKEIGIAVLCGDELLHFAVKTFKRKDLSHGLQSAVEQLISGLIQKYRPQCLSIEKPLSTQKIFPLFTQAFDAIKRTARASGLPVFEYDPAIARERLCQSEKATKSQAAERLAQTYPELARYLVRPTKWEEVYWSKVFCAVCIGLMCVNEIYQPLELFRSH